MKPLEVFVIKKDNKGFTDFYYRIDIIFYFALSFKYFITIENDR